jgi:hypothetical protein
MFNTRIVDFNRQILIRKKTTAYYVSIFYFIVYEATVLVYHTIYHYLGLTALILTIISLVLALISFGLLIRAKALFKEEDGNIKADSSKETKKFAFLVMITNIIGVLALLFSIMFVPLYTINIGQANEATCMFYKILFVQSITAADSAYFLSNFLLLIVGALIFLSSFSYYFSDKKEFVRLSKILTFYELFVSLEFFLMGYTVQFVNALSGSKTSTMSFIPLIIMFFLTLLFSYCKGKFDSFTEKEEEDKNPSVVKSEKEPLRIEPLIYVLLVTLVTISSLFLNIIRVNFTSSVYNQSVTLTGLKLLSDYASLGGGYQLLAFYLVAMLICSGLGLLMTLNSYIAGYKYYANVAKAVAYMNFFFILAFGVSGFYFSIAQEINKESTEKVIAYYYSGFNASYTYTIKTDTIYSLAVDTVIMAIMMIRKALDGNINTQAVLTKEGENKGSSASQGAAKLAGPEDEEGGIFDPCPAFTEIDAKEEAFKTDLAERKKLFVGKTSLNDLVKFIVEYARDSRLHLSYSQEDIATFVSGLGACRLSILQGMSGTGKTSLPKIFSEAIDGNCEIIEVESSWKDKNELLGYYNEFSSKYTPKKFTQALYKATLNQEIPTFIVLDEMNLSRIEYYFSDFLSLMENEEGKREIKLLNIKLERREADGKKEYKGLSEGHTIKVPSNIWFIGTANRDESTFVISDKVYDRAHTMNFNKRAPKVRDYSNPISQKFYTYQTIADLFSAAKKKGTFDAENNELIKKTEVLLAPYNISFGNRILHQIEDFVNIYVECFPGKDVLSQAVETILLSKVVSKLEVKTIEDKDELAKEFENLGLNRCAEFINKLNED